jgi:hypothetical protein
MPEKLAIELVVDSGAYSAWTQGKAVDLDAYIAFLLKNEKYITHSVNLDVINPEGPDVAAAAGWTNFLKMRDAGVVTMPVFHAREKLSWLEKMLDAVPYVGLSATSLVSPVEGRYFYDICWHYCTDSKGRPIANFHAFGDTSPYSLLNYPFYSADSATWMIQAGRAARIKLQGKSIQFRSSKMRDTSYIASSDTGPKRQSWEEEFRSLGLDPTIAMNVAATPSETAMIRSYLVASDLLKLQEKTRTVTRFKKPVSLVVNKRSPDGGTERDGPCKVYFVLSPSAYYFNLPLIAALGIKNVLVSYFYVEGAPKAFWDERLVPFLYDPIGFCETHPKLKRYWDKIQECILKAELAVI